MAIIPVPQLADNYAYLIADDASATAGVVDCAEAEKIVDAARHNHLRLISILTTHWHGDHSGGNSDLVRLLADLRVYGAAAENGRIPSLTNPIGDGDRIRIDALEGRVIGIPAHTSGHVAYYFPSLKAVFSGDTLFIGGCGRVFEGKAATMMQSLGKLAALPDDTQVFCGHEYTEKNLRFALTLEPGNQALKRKHEWAVTMRAEGRGTIPSTIGEEKQTNPFLRTESGELRASLKQIDPSLSDDPIALFAKVRALKDAY